MKNLVRKMWSCIVLVPLEHLTIPLVPLNCSMKIGPRQEGACDLAFGAETAWGGLAQKGDDRSPFLAYITKGCYYYIM